MHNVELGRSGLKVSAMGIGMWQAGGAAWGKDVGDEEYVKTLVRAKELGINLVDTAEAYGYGHSEEVVGKAIKEIGRDQIVIATKVSGYHLRHDDVIRACEGSLKRLGVEEIDLYQIHWLEWSDLVPLKQAMKALEKLQVSGKIRAIGVSNFAVRDIQEANSLLSRTSISSNMVQYSLIHREIEEEVLPYCRKENITILAWSPLARGALTGKYSPENRPRDPAREDDVGRHIFSDSNLPLIMRLVSKLKEIGRARGKTPVQVALNWLMRDVGVVPVPGAKRPEQVEENAGAVGWSLSSSELHEIQRILEGLVLDHF